MKSKKGPGIRCDFCGSYYDSQDGQCDCGNSPDAVLSIKRTIEHNKAVMNTAFSNDRRIVQAYKTFDFK